MNKEVQKYLSQIGRRGGRKSRRVLDAPTAKQMVKIREARRAFRRFRTSCFWSYDPNYQITADDVSWVAKQLMQNGGRDAWELGVRLCR